MADITFFILGILILVGFVGHLLFSVTKVPEVLFLILAGMLLGPVFGIVDPTAVMGYAAVITTLMLITVMLDNGLSFDIFRVVRALPLTTIFTTFTVGLTAFATTLILHFMLDMAYLPAAILAFAMAGTTTDVITAIISPMRLPQKTKQLLTFESVLNDIQLIPFFILLHFALTASIDKFSAAKSLLFLMPLAIIIGSGAAIWWVFVLGKFLGKHPLNYVATIGILFIVYNITQILGGHGAVAVLTFSLIFGNALGLFKKFRIRLAFTRKFTLTTIKAFKQIELDVSFFVKTFFFVFLGLVFSFRTLTKEIVLVSVAILAAIILCRYILARFLAWRSVNFRNSVGALTWIMPRGYIAAVLAFAAASSGLFEENVVEIVLMNIFLTTLVSIGYSIYYERMR